MRTLLTTVFSYRTLFLCDVLLCLVILMFMPYTEVDWEAYMQEVSGFLSGQLDYTQLKGDTGPLVYPGGFLYVYSALYYVTNQGTNIFLAQLIFGGIYLLLTAVVMHVYGLVRIPFGYTMVLVLSRRIHSIFLLRMFNDGVAMLFLYIAVLNTAWREWIHGAFWFSLAVSVKMNVLLFAPGFLAVWLGNVSLVRTIGCIAVCALVQLAAGWPFLVTYPMEYLSKAFELSRVFTYKWTVNYKFLSEELFTSKYLSIVLLVCTMTTWLWVALRVWRTRDLKSCKGVVLTLFESNMIGIIFSRTMHYQFYTWFFHQVPLLLCLHASRLHWALRIAVVIGLEYGFTVYPSTPMSSAAVMLALAMVWWMIVRQ